MSLKKAHVIGVEVDMVPLIDIISLLLMFLIMVGDMAKSASNVHMTLPRADMAINDTQYSKKLEGRIVVQLEKQKDSRYMAKVENAKFDLVEGGASKSLREYLERLVTKRQASMKVSEDSLGGFSIPVKLRIGEDAPMYEVERVMMALARARLTNVQYAAQKVERH
jgi:biopolymer transport protein ExbD